MTLKCFPISRKNSRAETKSETEGQFQQGFVASSGAIIGAINIMSYLIIGIILLVLGIIGEYVGRIYGEIKQRPLYIIQDKLGFDK